MRPSRPSCGLRTLSTLGSRIMGSASTLPVSSSGSWSSTGRGTTCPRSARRIWSSVWRSMSDGRVALEAIMAFLLRQRGVDSLGLLWAGPALVTGPAGPGARSGARWGDNDEE